MIKNSFYTVYHQIWVMIEIGTLDKFLKKNLYSSGKVLVFFFISKKIFLSIEYSFEKNLFFKVKWICKRR